MEPYDLRRLRPAGDRVREPLTEEWLEERLNEGVASEALRLECRGPGQADLHLEWINPDAPGVVRVKGQVEAPLATCCVRCLGEVRVDVACPVDLTLFPAAKPGEGDDDDDAEAEAEARSLDEGTYQGMTLDLPEVVREAVLLDVDPNPRCQDTEACGKRTDALLAEASGGGDEPAIDPRWAPLKNIRLKSN